ncbi:MAG: tRNA-dihydrouridine synthase, partial [Planctomycetaceae bacterium]
EIRVGMIGLDTSHVVAFTELLNNPSNKNHVPGAKVVAAFKTYDVDGVMIARASLGRPWLFAQAAAALRGEAVPPEPDLPAQRDCMLNHYQLVLKRFGEEKGTMLMRKFACCYAQGKPGARHFRTHVAGVATPQEFMDVVERYFPTGAERDGSNPCDATVARQA